MTELRHRGAGAMYKLVHSATGKVVCEYKAKSIALRDCEKKNAELLRNRWIVDRPYYVLKPNGGKVTA